MNTKSIPFLFFAFFTIHSIVAQNCSQIYQGEGTFYSYSGNGNCSFPNPAQPVFTGAMNEIQYNGSATCGACVEVKGAKGSLVISIEDRCPECKSGDIDLSQEAFTLIDDPVKGRVPITWKFVSCPVTGPVQFYFKEGSSQYWTAVQVRNHRNPVAKLEYKSNGQYIELKRETYNYFLAASGMGPGPYSFRITDMFGEVIEEPNIPLLLTQPISGVNQFKACTSTRMPEYPWSPLSVTVTRDPSSGILNFTNSSSETVLAIIFNSVGQEVHKINIPSPGKTSLQLSNGGIYFVHLKTEDRNSIKKMAIY